MSCNCRQWPTNEPSSLSVDQLEMMQRDVILMLLSANMDVRQPEMKLICCIILILSCVSLEESS